MAESIKSGAANELLALRKGSGQVKGRPPADTGIASWQVRGCIGGRLFGIGALRFRVTVR